MRPRVEDNIEDNFEDKESKIQLAKELFAG
jgi:hypothetical protein